MHNQLNRKNSLAHCEQSHAPSLLQSQTPYTLPVSSQHHRAGSGSKSSLFTQGYQEDEHTASGSCWSSWERMSKPGELFHFLIRKISLTHTFQGNVLQERKNQMVTNFIKKHPCYQNMFANMWRYVHICACTCIFTHLDSTYTFL